MIKIKSLFLTSILAGMLISIGGWTLLYTENRIIGAFLFSFALFSICLLKLPLFTGRIGKVSLTKESISNIIFILIGNIIGTAIIGFFYFLIGVPEVSFEIVSTKIGEDIIRLILESILCGLLMEIAVSNFSSNNSFIGTSLPVVVFILIGAEHSIANSFYFIAGKCFPIFYILINILGNAIGAIITYRIIEGGTDGKKEIRKS